MSDIEFGLKLRVDNSEAAKIGGATAEIAKFGETARQAGTGLKSSSAEVQALLDKYDPLGAKLKSLQADFKALDNAARTGQFGSRDDTRIDAAYRNLLAQTEAARAGSAVLGATGAKAFADLAEGANKGAFATAQARRELIVLGHEAISGNFARMPGSFMVLAERIGLSGGAMIGVLGPIAAFAVGLGVLIKAAVDGEAEFKAMNNALATTSGFAGLTRGGMLQLADQMTRTGQVTIGQSKDIVTALVASGQIGAQSIGAVANLASRYADATGQDIAKIAPQLVKLFADPARGASELNQTMHFLTASELDHINALERAGHLGEAQLELANQTIEHLKNQTREMGTLATAWDLIKKSASSAWSAMLGMGVQGGQEELGRIKNTLAVLGRGDNSDKLESGHSERAERINELITRRIEILRTLRNDEAKARSDAKTSAANDEQVAKLGLVNSLNSSSTQGRLTELKRQLDDLDTFKATTPDLAQKWANAKQELRDQIAKLQKPKTKPITYTDIYDDNGDVAYQVNSKDKQTARQIERMQATYKSMEAEMAAERAKAKKEFAALDTEVAEGLATSIAKLGGNAYGVAFAGVDKQITALRKKLTDSKIADYAPDQYAQMVESINALSTARYNEAEATAAQQSVQQVENDRNEALKLLQAEVTAGLKTQTEARRAGISINQTALDGLGQHLDVLKKLAAQGYAPAIEALKKFDAPLVAITDAAKDKTWKNGLTDGLKDYAGQAIDTFQTVKDATRNAMKGMEDALVNFVKTGKLNFKSMADSIISDLIRIQIQKSITHPLSNMMSAGMAWMFSANGNVFDAPALHAYSNTIVDKPTVFPFAAGAGIMGEAGPEAIMPLKRGANGQLGVQGAGGNVQVNVYNNTSGTQATTRQRTGAGGANIVDVIIEQVKGAIAGDIARGNGSIPAAMSSTYGLNRVAGAY